MLIYNAVYLFNSVSILCKTAVRISTFFVAGIWAYAKRRRKKEFENSSQMFLSEIKLKLYKLIYLVYIKNWLVLNEKIWKNQTV